VKDENEDKSICKKCVYSKWFFGWKCHVRILVDGVLKYDIVPCESRNINGECDKFNEKIMCIECIHSVPRWTFGYKCNATVKSVTNFITGKEEYRGMVSCKSRNSDGKCNKFDRGVWSHIHGKRFEDSRNSLMYY
jgi:hypothetical protein